jgi:methionyl-tRNA formyltransferase
MSINIQNLEQVLESGMKVLFFGRFDCQSSSKALNHLTKLGFKVTAVFSKGYGDALPDEIKSWTGDYIFCFRSMYILPKYLIDKAKVAAINFHPGSPEFPGSGCLNYALYENSKLYGVTSHLMTEKVDDGQIIECRRFPIHSTDDVDSLLERTHAKLLDLFFDIISGIALNGGNYIGESLNNSRDVKWSGVKRKIKDLDDLSIIDIGVSKNELEKLIRAACTEKFPLKIKLHGYEFILKSRQKLN